MSNVYYKVFSENQSGFQVTKKLLDGDLASDETYFQWWSILMDGKTDRRPKELSKGNAEWIAQDACKQFSDKIREYDRLFPKADLPVPGCAVMLATDTSMYIVLDFSNWFYAKTVNYVEELADTFGKAFDGTAYEGQVIFRSPWDETGKRTYEIYHLSGIELVWQESQAGGREDEAKNEAKAGVELLLRGEGSGVQDRNDYGNTSSIAAVVKTAPITGTDRVLVDLTNGSEWSVKQEDAARCPLTVGMDVLVSWRDSKEGQPKVRQYTLWPGPSMKTSVPADFVQGW
jgi:hypothetical protein